MVFVANKKYACETCIKGHRSSTCKHADRPLFEIKKKGRPVTQCEHCRELRKTKQVHVKCMCSADLLSRLRKGTSLLPTSAMFPSGLSQQVLEASVALASSLSDLSESDHSSISCDCDNTDQCGCAVPRKSTRKGVAQTRPRRESTNLILPSSIEREPLVAGPAGIVASAHAGGHRPVLPRPPSSGHGSSFCAHHVPCPLPHGMHRPRVEHYSPYERAYDVAHPVDANAVPNATPSSTSDSPQPANAATSFGAWLAAFDSPSDKSPPVMPAPPSVCYPACARVGSTDHSGQESAPCADPNSCGDCLECAMLALVPAPAHASSTHVYALADVPAPDIDGWLRAMSVLAADPRPIDHPAASDEGPVEVFIPGSDVPYDPGDLQTYALWNDLAAALSHPRPVLDEWDADPLSADLVLSDM